ncbi:DUF192 domain-containing protein [Neobacillus niacini]|uniref:DUF192 domain-containing protein n=1 Tax=Neobacillus niacini TaxID=86668 RepID=UPI0021CB0EBE|nr:DUF192 domain-containing protein [Neobacillus niacini]MCM3765804.1 DUF192 domain-containing protein [Neobacillus niacini]
MKGSKINIPFRIKVADSFSTRLKGLMFRKEPIKSEGLWIVPCNAVHMFFMRFPIDIVLLNKQNVVVRVYQHLKPWRMTKPLKYAYSTLELPAGSTEKLGIKNGCIIHFSNLGK